MFSARRILLLSSFALLPSLTLAYTSDDYYKAGLSFYQQRDYATAIRYLKAAGRMDPNNWQAEQLLGSCYYLTGDNADALAAFDASLQANPSNPQLRSFADNLRAQASVASSPVTSATEPPPGSQTAVSPAATPQPAFVRIPFIFRRGRWVNLHLGVIDASLGDLQSGADAFNKLVPSSVGTASNSGLGFLLGGEGGISFDPENAIGLAVNLGIFGGYKDSFPGTPYHDTFTPMMIAVEPLYHHFFLMGNSRIRLEAGPGLYVTSLQANQNLPSNFTLDGAMAGYGFGGCLGLGWDLSLGMVSLNAFVHGRLASTSNIQGQFKDQAGVTHQVGLIKDSSNNGIGTADTSYIGSNGISWASVDYTGFDLGLAVSYRY